MFTLLIWRSNTYIQYCAKKISQIYSVSKKNLPAVKYSMTKYRSKFISLILTTTFACLITFSLIHVCMLKCSTLQGLQVCKQYFISIDQYFISSLHVVGIIVQQPENSISVCKPGIDQKVGFRVLIYPSLNSKGIYTYLKITI